MSSVCRAPMKTQTCRFCSGLRFFEMCPCLISLDLFPSYKYMLRVKNRRKYENKRNY